MSQLLNSLADKLGIATEYTFGCGGDVKHCSVNEDLIAGIRIKINDDILDNSAATQLSRMKNQVMKTTL